MGLLLKLVDSWTEPFEAPVVRSGLSEATQACFDMSAGLKHTRCCLTLFVAGDGVKLR